jgi:dolichol-phosphate mannosyltransferase
MNLVSVVIPVYFNEESLPILYERLAEVAKDIKRASFEFIFVDDGSGDRSFEILEELSKRDSHVKIVKLSRNFGSFVACLAGLSYARGDCAAIIAADLQDPPELLKQFYEKWEKGSKVVCAVRESRKENPVKVFLANIYYRLMKFIALKDMPKGGFDFVLIDRKVIDVLVHVKEKNTTLMGQILWTGFSMDVVYYCKEERKHGKSKWSLSKKIKYFIDSFLAFSYFPIRIISMSGIFIALLAFLYGIYAIIKKILFGVDVPGFTTLIVVILFTSGTQMIMLGVVGEYLWRNLEETRKRPIFIVDRLIGIE